MTATNLPPAEISETGRMLTDAEKRLRRMRSIAIALALAALVAMFYVVTIAKLGANILNRPL